MKQISNTKCGQGGGVTETLIHCSSECTLIQSLWEIFFFGSICGSYIFASPFDSAVPLLGIQLLGSKSH